MPVTITITIEAEDLADVGRQLDDAVSAFRPLDPTAYTADHDARANAATPRKGRVSAAARAQAAGGDTGADGAAGAEGGTGEGLGARGLEDGGDGPDDHLAALVPEGVQGPPAARRRRANGRGAEETQALDKHAALSANAAGGQADGQVASTERGAATLAEVQSLAKTLGGREEKGVAAVQRVFAEHGVKTPKDIDPAKLEILRDAFELELAL